MTAAWQDPAYADMVDNPVMIDLFSANAAALGRTLADPVDVPGVVGSTDMGNVSYQVPSIHPMIAVSPPDVAIHTPEFAEHARSEAGDKGVLDGAKAMAMTVADLWLDAESLALAQAAFTEAVTGDRWSAG